MSTKTVKELSKQLQKIDFCMLNTFPNGGSLSSRPMSNNGDVEYDGGSFFSLMQTHKRFATSSTALTLG